MRDGFVHGRSGRFGDANSPVPVQGIEQRFFGCPFCTVVTVLAELSELNNTGSMNSKVKLQKFYCCMFRN